MLNNKHMLLLICLSALLDEGRSASSLKGWNLNVAFRPFPTLKVTKLMAKLIKSVESLVLHIQDIGSWVTQTSFFTITARKPQNLHFELT